jgi:hypothetical protein
LDRRYCYWYPFSIRHHKAAALTRPFDYSGGGWYQSGNIDIVKKHSFVLHIRSFALVSFVMRLVAGSSCLSWRVREQCLVVADGRSLHALLALLGDEGDSLTLLEGLEAVLL